MSDYIGTKAIDLNSSPAYAPISKVVLIVSETDEYVAGDDSGRTMEIECPWGTQAMANNLLLSLSGYTYQPIEVQTAYEADPLWELGDSISANGISSVLAHSDISFGKGYSADISAPNSEELNHEYPYSNPTENAINRRIARTAATLKVEMDNIEGKVSGLAPEYVSGTTYHLNDIVYYNKKYWKCNVTNSSSTWVASEWVEQENGAMSSIIKQTLGSIELTATAGTNSSTIRITANGIVMDTAVVTFSNIIANSVVANSQISAPRIYGGMFYDSLGASSLHVYGGVTDSGMVFENEELDLEVFKVEAASYGHSSFTDLYLQGVRVAGCDGSSAYLKNIESIETESSNGIRLYMQSGRYWEISGNGMYYKDTNGTILNYVKLAM